MDDARAGEVIVRADAIGTGLFALAAGVAAIVFSTPAQWVGALTSITLFAAGCAAFLWAFYNAVQRSRVEQIAVTQLFLLVGDPIPRRVRRTMLTLLVIQCVVALTTALARPDSTDGSPGSSLALGVLAPMFGLGMNGLWAAYHGRFPLRTEEPGGQDGRTSATRIDKNGAHG